MKPEEYWNARYREVVLYCNVNLFKITDDIKQNVELFEAVTDKIIMSNSMCVKKPKFVKLKEMFGNLFKKKEQTVEEQIKMLRRMKG